MRKLLGLLLSLLALAPCGAATIITNASIIDGTGAPARPGNVRIDGDRITAVGTFAPAPGDTIVDAHGLTLAPGFIDSHSHHDRGDFAQRSMAPLIAQGVTTIVIGADGFSDGTIADRARRYAAAPASVNVASHSGHGSLRSKVMGKDFKRSATPAEVKAMQDLLAADMRAGSLGLSTGLEYDPAIYSDKAEVLALAQTAAGFGGRYISHMRSEDVRLDDAIDELLEIGRVTRMPVQISHFKIAIVDRWGQAKALLAKLDKARLAGIDVTADVYPYEYWQSTLSVLMPGRDFRDREAAVFALTKLSTPEGMLIGNYAPEPALAGRTIAQVAAARKADPYDTYLALIRDAEAFAAAHPDATDVESVIGTSMAPADVADFIAWPHSNICSDGLMQGRHPRNAGSFAKVLRLYVREQQRLTLVEAVHKMTGLSAAHMGLADRGVIRPGAMADLVLFDPATISDHADVTRPGALATGVDRVWVNGVAVLADGKPSGAYPGRFLLRPAAFIAPRPAP
ncbi:N-acyl-D-amino-acid deacylase family protein [Sandarakinorhabdus sp. DWP1-3-1]|uniref:N-acyl-D-amino-acid deacylase family protein n=1 Tax=Sandarakinorhabdus sp. DWP1-3-1 TaxID=2804627 RepID=UPI003CF7F901